MQSIITHVGLIVGEYCPRNVKTFLMKSFTVNFYFNYLFLSSACYAGTTAVGGTDCRLFAIANAMNCAIDPNKVMLCTTSHERDHIIECFKPQFLPFPK